jgi:hypothetical protein
MTATVTRTSPGRTGSCEGRSETAPDRPDGSGFHGARAGAAGRGYAASRSPRVRCRDPDRPVRQAGTVSVGGAIPETALSQRSGTQPAQKPGVRSESANGISTGPSRENRNPHSKSWRRGTRLWFVPSPLSLKEVSHGTAPVREAVGVPRPRPGLVSSSTRAEAPTPDRQAGGADRAGRWCPGPPPRVGLDRIRGRSPL